jgi:hypothetical protein
MSNSIFKPYDPSKVGQFFNSVDEINEYMRSLDIRNTPAPSYGALVHIQFAHSPVSH